MEVIDNLVAEFFILRSKPNPRVMVSSTNLLSSLQLQDSVNLKVSSVLRDISDSLIQGTINEETLDLLETLKNLQQQQDSLDQSSLKSAYCWSAVECTVRFMWPMFVSDGLFIDAIERIWKNRIRVLKESGSDLVSNELLKWESEFKKAIDDHEVYQRIRECNVRFHAISFLTKLLNEQCGLVEISSLESISQKMLLKASDDDLENGGKTVSREFKDHLLKIQGHMEQEPNNVIPQVTRDGQDHNEETPQQHEKRGLDNQGTSSSSSPLGVRAYHLPTPIPLKVTPLRKIAARRPRRFWTREEEEAIREGVLEFGKSWKDIKDANPTLFAERTAVDLKDKWRNLAKRPRY